MARTIRVERNTPADARRWHGGPMWFPVRNGDTLETFSMQRAFVPARGGPLPHCHGREEEIFLVLSGSLGVRVGRETHDLGAGDCVLLPRGVVHQPWNRSDEPAEVLTVLTPGRLEESFWELSADAEASPGRVAETMGRYGVVMLDEYDADFRHPEVAEVGPALARRRSECPRVWLAGDTYTVLLGGADTGGWLCVLHFDVPPGGGPVPHKHTRDDEFFHVIAGEVALYADGERTAAGAGETIVLPRGLTHGFRNKSDTPALMFALLNPSGFDEMALEVGRPVTHGGPPPRPDEAELHRIAAAAGRHGVELHPEIEV